MSEVSVMTVIILAEPIRLKEELAARLSSQGSLWIFEVWLGVEKGVRRKYVRILNDGRSLITDPELSSDKPWCQFGGKHGETCPLDLFPAYLQAHSVGKWDEACKV
ncbi:hypothetical protein GGF32_007199 [Allomyces javanicus]|nr:hypothetical protein GGF32_007199 [Allomyces javanicus]